MSTLYKKLIAQKEEQESSLYDKLVTKRNAPKPEPVPVDYAARTAETASKAKSFASSMASATEEQKVISDLTQKENLLAEETQRVNQFATNDGEEAPRNIRELERQASGAKATAQTVLIPKKYENVTRTAENVTKPGIAGQAATWSMNFDVGRLSQEIAKATQQSIAEPTPENKKLVETLKTTYDKYIERNREAMFYTDKNGEQRQRGNALTLTFANYVPQLIDQIAAQVPAVIAAGAVGAATGGAGFNPTLKALGALTAGQMSYNVVRGSAYDNLLSLGIPEDKAKALSQSEAFKSTAVEMLEYLVSFKALGFDKLAGAISALGTKVVADLVAKTGKEALAQAALRKFAKVLGSYGFNILSEGLEEYVQEGFAIESEKKGLGDARTATPEEDAKRKAESFKGGATIAAITGGPAIAGTTIATNKILSSKVGAQTATPTAKTAATPTTPTVQENVAQGNVEPVMQDRADQTTPIVESASVAEKAEVVGKGNMGEVIKIGDSVYKNTVKKDGTKTLEGEVYQALKGNDNVLSGEVVTVDGVEKIKTPYSKTIVSTDAIPIEKRAAIGKQIIPKNIGNILEAINDLSDKGYYYSDPLQFAFADNKLKLMDFSNVSKAAYGENVLSDNYSLLKNFLTSFGQKEYAEIISNGIRFKEVMQGITVDDIKNGDILLSENEANLLTDVFQNGIKPENVYYTTNDRAVQIKGIAQTDKIGNAKYVFSEKPLSEKQIKEYELNKIYVTPNEVAPQNKTTTQFSTGPKEELSTQAVEKKETLTKNATVGLNLNEYTGNLREDERRAIDVMGKVTKNKVIFSENVGTVDGKETVLGKGETPDNFQQQNGFYDPKTKTIFLNMDLEDKAFQIALHEITHHIQRSAPEAYARYKSVALEGALKLWGDGAVERTQAFAERSAGIQLTTEQAQDEIVADYIGYIYKDPARITNLYTTQKSFAVAIKDALTVLVNKIKRALSVMKYSKAERADMEAQKARYERDISMWEKAFDASSRGEGVVDGDVGYSLRDSEGRKLTEEQAEFFKDSKIRDKEGNLLRVYHGTGKNFTEFETQITPQFFTPYKEYADDYSTKGSKNGRGFVREVYLDIKNPFDTRNEKDREIYNTLYADYRASRGRTFSQIGSPRMLDFVEVDGFYPFINRMIREGKADYDGIVVDEKNPYTPSYVPLKSSQIKYIKNKNPTNSPDIRRSLRGAPTSPKTSAIKYNLPFVSTAPDGIIKRSDIEKFVASSIDRPVSSGKVRMRNVLGYFSVKSEAIRLKDPKNIPTLFHETGHFLDKRLEIFKDKDPKIQQELTTLGTPKSMPSYSAERVRGEGVAEFTKYYILDEQRMQNNYPNLYAKMEDIVSQDDNLKHMFEVLRTAIDNYRGMTPEQRFASNISMQDVTVKRKWDFDRLYTALFDDLNAIKLAVKEMTGGIDLKVDDDPYALATLNHSWQSLAQTYLESGFVDDKYEKSGKGLKEILDPIADKTTFQYYMVARRARELGLRQIKTGLEWQDVIDIIAKYDSEYAAPFAEVLEYQDNILRQLVKEQIISKEVYTAVKLMNQDYVPMYRVIESFNKSGTGKGMQASNPMRGIKGSEADIIAPLESIIKNTYLFTAMAEKNRIGLAFWRITENFDGTGKYMEKIPAPMKGQSFTISEIENVLLDAGLEEDTLKKINLNEVATIFRPGRYSKSENVITIYKDGKPMYFEVHNEDLYRALEGLDRESSNTLIKILSYPAKALRAGAILNPDFLGKNMLRDALTALIYSRYGFVPGFDTVRGLFHAVKKDKLYYQAMASGALQSSFVSMDRNYLQSSMKDLLTDSVKDKALNIVTNPLEALRMLSEFSESATRLGEFARGIEKYGSTREGVQRAALATREVAIDFARGGNVSKSANRAIAFFNSSLQGTDKMIREFKRDPFGMTLKSVAYITIPSLLLYAKNKDEPRYQELPDWQKDLFWIILTEDKIFRIPKPFELGVLFGSAFERIAEYIDKKDPKAFDGFGESLETSLVPGYLPTAMIPIIEALTNYSLFKQYRLVSDALLGKEPWAQYTEYTSETAKTIGKILNVSPTLVENTIYGYGAGLAKYGTDIVDVVLKAANLVEGKTTPEKGIEELPLIKGFMAVAYRNAASINEFYDLKTEISRKINTYDSVDPKLKLQQKQLEVTAVELGKIRKQIDAIYGNPRYTAERQKELIDKLNIQMVNLARRSLGKDPIKN